MKDLALFVAPGSLASLCQSILPDHPDNHKKPFPYLHWKRNEQLEEEGLPCVAAFSDGFGGNTLAPQHSAYKAYMQANDGVSEEEALAAVGLDARPESPSTVHARLVSEWKHDGLSTFRDVAYSYLRSDCRITHAAAVAVRSRYYGMLAVNMLDYTTAESSTQAPPPP